jgi:hypothetical protein
MAHTVEAPARVGSGGGASDGDTATAALTTRQFRVSHTDCGNLRQWLMRLQDDARARGERRVVLTFNRILEDLERRERLRRFEAECSAVQQNGD